MSTQKSALSKQSNNSSDGVNIWINFRDAHTRVVKFILNLYNLPECEVVKWIYRVPKSWNRFKKVIKGIELWEKRNKLTLYRPYGIAAKWIKSRVAVVLRDDNDIDITWITEDWVSHRNRMAITIEQEKFRPKT